MSTLIIAPLELLSADLTPSELKVALALYSFRNRTTDTVWPGYEAIGLRCGIADISKISKVIKALCKKGFLEANTTRARGESRREYRLILPEINDSQVGQNDQVGRNSQVGQNDQPQVGRIDQVQVGQNDQVVCEQPNEQPIEQPKRKFAAAEADLPESVDRTNWLRWVDYRKSKRKAITERAAAEQLKLLARFDHQQQRQMVSTSIANDYQGLFAPRGQGATAMEKRAARAAASFDFAKASTF